MFGAVVLPSTAQGNRGELRGRVAARDGSPLASANVSLDDGRQRAVTDGAGLFVIPEVNPGAHKLTVSFVGYRAFETSITIDAGAEEYLEIVLDERPSGSQVLVQGRRDPYRVQVSSTALKVPERLSETPASVQVITSARMAQAGAERVNDMFDYMTGVVQGGGTRAQAYLLRGIAVDDRFIPYQVDGISGGVWRQHEPTAALVERIEYLKGPSSVLYGITQLGGVLNYVTRKPKATPEASLQVRHNSYASEVSAFGARNGMGVTADVTGPLGSTGALLYRVIANQSTTTSYRDGVDESSLDVMPALTWNLGEATSMTASLNVNMDRGKWDEYLPVPKNDLSLIPALNTRINESADNYWDEGWGVGYTLHHALSEAWNLRTSARHTSRFDGRRLFESSRVLADSRTMARNYRDQANRRDYTYIDVAVDGAVTTGPLEHTLLAGGTFGLEKIHFDRRNLQGDSTLNVDIYAPVHDAGPMLPAKPGFDRYWTNNYSGIYAQDIIGIVSMVKAVLGAQFINANTDHEEQRSGLAFEKHDAGLVAKAGLVVIPFEGLTFYGSFGTSFSPTSAERENAEGTIDFKPERGRQVEGGLKCDLLESRLGATLAYYTIDYLDALNRTAGKNRNGNDIYVQTGRSRFSGLEAEVYASPIEEIYVSAGYSTTSSEVVEDTVATRIGSAVPYVPRRSGNVWITYAPATGPLQGLTVGIGAAHVAERPTDFSGGKTAPFVIPGYTRLDASISWSFARATIGVTVNNLADERYYVSGTALRIVPGAPRNIRTSLLLRL